MANECNRKTSLFFFFLNLFFKGNLAMQHKYKHKKRQNELELEFKQWRLTFKKRNKRGRAESPNYLLHGLVSNSQQNYFYLGQLSYMI